MAGKEKKVRPIGRQSPPMTCGKDTIKAFHCFQNVAEGSSKGLYATGSCVQNSVVGFLGGSAG